MKFEITSWIDGGVKFSIETDTLKLAVEAAVKSKANLRGADLRDANLRGADLRGADLRVADLWGANLRDADLWGANLRGADLRGADLRGADLWGANLWGANLRGADLRGADLRDADLWGADLRGANLWGADLWDAKNLTHFPIYVFGHKHCIQTTNDGRLQIGCEIHTFEEWTEKAEGLGAANNYSALDVEIYKLHIEHIARVSRLLWAKQSEKK